MICTALKAEGEANVLVKTHMTKRCRHSAPLEQTADEKRRAPLFEGSPFAIGSRLPPVLGII